MFDYLFSFIYKSHILLLDFLKAYFITFANLHTRFGHTGSISDFDILIKEITYITRAYDNGTLVDINLSLERWLTAYTMVVRRTGTGFVSSSVEFAPTMG